MDNINRELIHKSFLQREYTIKHSPYETEFEFYESVREGDTEKVKKVMSPLGGSGFGILSDSPLQSIKYHLVVSAALITRFCVEGGMEMEVAYNLSDIYILKCDRARTMEELSSIHREMIFDFTERMKHINRGELYSKAIIMCFDYIYDNLHKKFELDGLANAVGLSKSYISRLFHNEVGMTLSEYVMKKRIETASNMLKYSDYTPLEISNYLCFSSHSHFIQVFKKHTGFTPAKYKERYFRTNW